MLNSAYVKFDYSMAGLPHSFVSDIGATPTSKDGRARGDSAWVD